MQALDVLRGWALFGVLWSNLNDWYGTRDPITALDRGLSWMQNNLIESRFYTLLMLLFGIGFGIQLLRATKEGADLRTTYYRRSAALLAIGIVHGSLIWHGDILTDYALVAFALVMFRALSTRRVLIAAVLLYYFGQPLVYEIKFLAGLRYRIETAAPSDFVLAHGPWLQIEGIRAAEYWDRVGGYLQGYVYVLAVFLMGFWAVKSGYLRRVIVDPRSTRRLLFVALFAAAAGYASNAVAGAFWPPRQPPPDYQGQFPFPYMQLWILRRLVLDPFNWVVQGTSLAYAAVLLLLSQRPRGARLLRPLAATGRMALTTYLTQSVVCTLLFYGYGLGWYGQVTFTGMLLITLILYGCQMAASTWWLTRFRFGPAEWLWRKLTYGHVQSMRLEQARAV